MIRRIEVRAAERRGQSTDELLSRLRFHLRVFAGAYYSFTTAGPLPPALAVSQPAGARR
jgi:hypothetical protein